MINGYKHRDWLIWAIVSSIFGIFFSYTLGTLFGILGIIFSALANSAYKSGNIVEAQEKNRTAKIMTIISLTVNILGLLFILLYLLFIGSFLCFAFSESPLL